MKSVLYIKMDVHMEKIVFLLPKELTYLNFFFWFSLFRASSVDYNTSSGEDLQTADQWTLQPDRDKHV